LILVLLKSHDATVLCGVNGTDLNKLKPE
jgi:hypothetical protein